MNLAATWDVPAAGARIGIDPVELSGLTGAPHGLGCQGHRGTDAHRS